MRLLLPLLLALPLWLPFLAALRRGRRWLAAALAGGWALLLAAALPALEWSFPGACARLFPGAGPYAAGMVAWVATGTGCEASPACFLPQHGLHAAGFTVLTVATAGLGGLAAAAVLLGWMGAYGGALAGVAADPALGALVAWHPWAVVRVVAYLALGVALAEPLARRGLPPVPGRQRWVVAGVVGLLLDVILKALLAEAWRLSVLTGALGQSG